MTTPVIVVHGGAGTVAEDLRASAVTGTRAAAAAGQAVLLAGGSAEAAVIAAVRTLEDDPGFNAGRGACMNADGVFEADAAIMRSRDLRSGAVAGVREVRDTILLAALVMNETRHCLLVGDNAARFARERGVGHFGREEVWTAKAEAHFTAVRAGQQLDNRADTVGAVALDARGELCAAGSTGGVLYKLPGRVGDTPMVGSGLYAHPELGACATTGLGEAIFDPRARLRGAAAGPRGRRRGRDAARCGPGARGVVALGRGRCRPDPAASGRRRRGRPRQRAHELGDRARRRCGRRRPVCHLTVRTSRATLRSPPGCPACDRPNLTGATAERPGPGVSRVARAAEAVRVSELTGGRPLRRPGVAAELVDRHRLVCRNWGGLQPAGADLGTGRRGRGAPITGGCSAAR
ncbi:isoaspartyl peptidase/L-asparaginase [Nannocystis pusilla]|uniref:isoaspartyl peptidase/L-asparaginase n=1 Tax=Nannocystis pusilla TaxID=889268 RepID=UPI003DA36FE2